MKKRLKMLLPVFLLALVFGVILAVNAGAEEVAKYKVYISADTALNTAGDTIGGVTYDLVGGENGYVEVFHEIKTFLSDKTANADGSVVIGGETKEVWIYVNGTVHGKYVDGVNTAFGGSDFFGDSSNGNGTFIRDVNNKWITLHITSADVSDVANYGTLYWNSSITGTVWAFQNDVAFEKVNFKAKTMNANTPAQCHVGSPNRFYIGEGVTGVGINNDGVEGLLHLRMGARHDNTLKTNMTGTVLSGNWNTIDMFSGYRGHVKGNVTFNYGGTAKCIYLCGWGIDSQNGYNATSDKYSLFAKSGASGDYYNKLSINLTVNITGGTVTETYDAGFGSASKFADVVVTGSFTTNVSGDAAIKVFYGGGYRGIIGPEGNTGTVITNNIDTSSIGGITTFYGGTYNGTVNGDIRNSFSGTTYTNTDDSTDLTKMILDAYGGGVSNTVNGNIFNTVTGGTIAKTISSGGLRGGNSSSGTVTGQITNVISGGLLRRFFGGGAGTVGGGVVTDMIGGTITLGYGSFTGAITGNASYTKGGTTYSGANILNFFSGGSISTLYATGNTTNARVLTTKNHLMGTSISYFYGGSSTANLLEGSSIYNKMTSGTVSYFYGGVYSGGTNVAPDQYGIVGNVTNEITGGKISTVFYGGGRYGKVTGTVTNNISGTLTVGGTATAPTSSSTTTIALFYGGCETGTVQGNVVNNINGAKFSGNYYGAGKGEDAETDLAKVTGTVTNTVTNGGFATFFGAGHMADVGGQVTNRVYKGVFTSIRGGGYYSGSGNNRSRCLGGTLTRVTPANDADIVVSSSNKQNWVSGTGMSKVSGIATYTKDGVTYTGAVILEITGGTFNGTSGAGAASCNYCVGAADQAVTGDIVNLISGGVFSDFIAAGRLYALTGSVYNYISGGTFNGPNAISFGKGNMGSGAISGGIVTVITGGDIGYTAQIPAYLSSLAHNVNGTVSYVKDGVTYTGSVLTFISGTAKFHELHASGSTGGTIAGDVKTYISGGEITNFYSGNVDRTVNGSVETTVSGTAVTNFHGGSNSASDTLFVDLTAGNTSFAFEAQTGASADTAINVTAGAGTLTLTSLTGTPAITLSGRTACAHPYVTLPSGSAESDVALTCANGADVLFVGDSFIGGLLPVGSTIILEDEGNFALRYLYTPADVAAWTAAAGAAPTFTYSLDGTNFDAIALDENNIVIDNVQYKFFIISGIRAKNISGTVYVQSTATAADDEYSVAEACETVVAQSTNAAFVAFANALLDYGKAANAYHNNDATPVTYTVDVMDEGYTDLYTDESYKSGTGTLVNIRATSLVTKEALFLKFYMKVDPTVDVTTLKVWVNGVVTDIELEKNNGYYSAAYQVPANRMEELAVVEVKDADGALVSNTYADSVTSYCAKVISLGNTNAEYAAFTPLARYVEEFVAASTAYLSAN